MQIVLAGDANTFDGIAVAVASAARHNPDAEFFVIALDWPQPVLERLSSLETSIGRPVRAVTVDRNAFDAFVRLPPSRSSSVYLKLLVPDLLPAVSRALYLDYDTLVTGSLHEAWQAPLGPDFALAAVPCPTPDAGQLALSGTAGGAYINAGVMVMDLDLWRNDGLARRVMDRVADTPAVPHEEVAINAVCRGRILILRSAFNVYATETIGQGAFDDPADIRLLHYLGSLKPWLCGRETFEDLWWDEARRLGALVECRPRPTTMRQWLRYWNSRRRSIMGWMAGKSKHADYPERRRRINDAFLIPRRL